MRAIYQLLPEYIPAATCQHWIELATKLPAEQGVIGLDNAHRNETIRRSTVRWIPRHSHWLRLYERVEAILRSANAELFGFDVGAMLDRLQFTEYHGAAEGQNEQPHFYDWHQDLDWVSPRPFQRKLSLVIQLSDPGDYRGGNLELRCHPPVNFRLMRRRGTTIVFPSFIEHRVTEVRTGLRYSLVAWLEGPKFR